MKSAIVAGGLFLIIIVFCIFEYNYVESTLMELHDNVSALEVFFEETEFTQKDALKKLLDDTKNDYFKHVNNLRLLINASKINDTLFMIERAYLYLDEEEKEELLKEICLIKEWIKQMINSEKATAYNIF